MSAKASEGGWNSTYNTHALPSGKQGGDTNKETEKGEGSPATVCGAQGDDNGVNDTGDDSANTKASSECLPWWIAIADCPADKVGMCLMAKGPFNGGNDISESRRMSGD